MMKKKSPKHRFFIPSKSIQKNQILLQDKGLVHQLSRVLRFQEGDQAVFLDNRGKEYLASFARFSRDQITAKILEKNKIKETPKYHLNLYVALLKNQNRFEWILEKGTELGVTSFIPLITKRTGIKILRKEERLQKIIQEAAEQSERVKLPSLKAPQNLQESLEKVNDDDFYLIAYEEEKKEKDLRSTLSMIPAGSNIHLFIGPEGGFEEEEIRLAQEKGLKTFSLGKRVLRTETAAIGCTSIILL